MPYDATRVRVAREGITPKPLARLVGPPGREVLSRIRERALKTEDEISSTPAEEFVQPYSDPHLRGGEGLRGLVDRLLPTGFLTFRRRAIAKVGVFTVAKKDGSQRLVFDCRVSNALCRDAPHTELATANALCNLDLSDEALGQVAANADDSAAISFAAADLTDGFYQFALDDVASLFCLDITLAANEAGVSEVLNEETGEMEEVSPGERLWVALRVLPMGWSWALWFCQDCLTEAMVAAESTRSGRSAATIRREQLLGDRRPAPALRPGKPILAPYVDNGNFICWSPGEGADCFDAFAAELNARGLAFKDVVRGDRELICLGLHCDGPNRLIKNRPDRVWRQYYALHDLLRQRRCSGKILEVVAGNIINSFMVDRTCLSVLSHIWQRAIELDDEVE